MKITKQFRDEDGIDLLSAPRITTMAGRSAITSVEPTSPDDEIISVSLINPEILPNLLDVRVRISITISEKRVGAQAGEPATTPGYRQISYSVMVSDGHSVLFMPEPRNNTVKRLVYVITPVMVDPAGNRIHTEEETIKGSSGPVPKK